MAAENAGTIARIPSTLAEIEHQLKSANAELADLRNPKNELSDMTRFLISNECGHNFLQAALRMKGYRTTNEKGHRQSLYNLLPELLPGAAGSQETLSDAHNKRNKLTYEAAGDITAALLEDMLDALANLDEEAKHALRDWKKANAPPAPSPAPAPGPGPVAANNVSSALPKDDSKKRSGRPKASASPVLATRSGSPSRREAPASPKRASSKSDAAANPKRARSAKT